MAAPLAPALGARPASDLGALLRLAWPAVLSYLLTNAYRGIDQYWVAGLGAAAQDALGACFFVAVMNYAFAFLAAGGALALVSQAIGARDAARADQVSRHALLLAGGIGLALSGAGLALAEPIVGWIGLEGEEAVQGLRFLRPLFLGALPLALVPTLDYLFLARGNSRWPMALQAVACALNWVLNPLLIYGAEAVQHAQRPGCGPAAWLGEALDFHGLGIAGAAWATVGSRALTSLLALAALRWRFGLRLRGSLRPKRAVLARIAAISLPNAISIGLYSGIYWALFGAVIAQLPPEVKGGFGLGFQVFEGASFPCYYGLAMATAALVGQRIGARDLAGAWRLVPVARGVALVLGLFWMAVFLSCAGFLPREFFASEAVRTQALLYAHVLAASQVFVAQEAVNEKVLLGAGRTRAILWAAGCGNAARLPLAWWFALRMGGGALALYWVINATSVVKAALFWTLVQRRDWLRASGSPD